MPAASPDLLIVTTETIAGKSGLLSQQVPGGRHGRQRQKPDNRGSVARLFGDAGENGLYDTPAYGRESYSLRADAVIGMRLVTSNVAEGAAELIGYGTAVRFVAE